MFWSAFGEFPLNFIHGAGQVDGEILETLWASLDKVVGSTRSMSCAHWQEVLDEYMNDSNWKKMCGAEYSVAALVVKIDRADEGFDTTQEAFQEFSQRVGPEFGEKWEQEERTALSPRGIGCKAETTKGTQYLSFHYNTDATTGEPGLDEVCHQLMAEEKKDKGQLSGFVALITDGLNIKRNLQKYIISLGRRPTAAQKRNVIVKQDNLQKRCNKFEKSMSSFIRKHNIDESSDGDPSDNSEGEEEEEEGDNEWGIVLSEPEDEGAMQDTPESGSEMQEGQTNDALRQLCLALGVKAWRLRNDVRNAGGGKGKTRTWSGVKTKDLEVRRYVQIYTQAVAALCRMGARAKWKPITKKDLLMSGQRSSTLPWFWHLEDGGALGEMEASSEMTEFYRVDWLWAKARVARWTEEKSIVAKEMQRTVKSFQFLCDEWALRATNAGVDEHGLRAYAEKQVDVWNNFAGHAEAVFKWAKSTSKRERWRQKGPKPISLTEASPSVLLGSGGYLTQM
ncbi:hypothetical protein B0H16DRAFT_1452497 [Mycena metata]|uniref:Uncharacterized protein n=1 Tax=Mycena metata TaxID=1033252 RepID=A0AAD7JPW7_9AGAR|nr:hypothetical protein B0H16DRAFT_1452497 [Mycena metata]